MIQELGCEGKLKKLKFYAEKILLSRLLGCKTRLRCRRRNRFTFLMIDLLCSLGAQRPV